MEAVPPRKQEVLAWEAEWGKRLAIITLLGIVIVTVSIIALGSVLNSSSDAETLRDVADKSSTVLLLAVSRAIGFLMVPAVLFFLFRATAARREPPLPPIVATVPLVGALMLSIGSLCSYFAVHKASDDFATQAVGSSDPEKVADDVLKHTGAVGDFASILPFAGLFLLGLFALLSAMWAMRVGLLTRFWGTLGMAVSAFFFLLPNFPFFFFVYLAYLSLRAGQWIANRPPAWDAVEAMPWPVGGMRADTAAANPANPADDNSIDVGGREVDSGEGDPHNPPLPDERR